MSMLPDDPSSPLDLPLTNQYDPPTFPDPPQDGPLMRPYDPSLDRSLQPVDPVFPADPGDSPDADDPMFRDNTPVIMPTNIETTVDGATDSGVSVDFGDT